MKVLILVITDVRHQKLKQVTRWMSALLLLATVLAPQAFAQNRVLQLVLTEDKGPVTDVTKRSMAVELERAGLQVESREAPTDGMSPEELFSLAEAADAQYVAELRFDSAGETASFGMVLYDGATGASLASLDKENVPLELEYDTVVARSARALLAEAGVRFDRVDAGEESMALPATDESADPGFSQVPVSPEPPGVGREEPAIGENGFAFGVGIAPALVTGDASDYLKFGFLASLSGGYRFRGSGMTVGLDLLAGAAKLYPEGLASTLDLYLLPFGPSLRVESSSSAALRVGVRTSGGAALLAVSGGPQGDLAKLVPYALGGVEISYQVARSVLLRLESNYAVFFEEVYPIMAFSPSLSVEWQI